MDTVPTDSFKLILDERFWTALDRLLAPFAYLCLHLKVMSFGAHSADSPEVSHAAVIYCAIHSLCNMMSMSMVDIEGVFQMSRNGFKAECL